MKLKTHLSVFVFIVILQQCFSVEDDQNYRVCSEPLVCGKISIRSPTYPFWGAAKPESCGRKGFELICEDQKFIIKIGGTTFQMLDISKSTPEITIAYDLVESCPTIEPINLEKTNFTISRDMKFIYLSSDCPSTTLPVNIQSFPTCSTGTRLGWIIGDSNCISTRGIPLFPDVFEQLKENPMTFMDAMRKGFELNYDTNDDVCSPCRNSGGICGSKLVSGEFQCFCRDGPEDAVCPEKGGGTNWSTKIIVAIVASIFGVVAACAGCYMCQRRKMVRYAASSVLLSRNVSSEPSSGASEMEKGRSVGGVHMFTYEELEQATNSFDPSKELGDGGFGIVYYGKLRDGRVVAVKRLYENNYKRVEQFLNEIEILTNLAHPNLVSLYGCTSRTSRDLLLVYEYVPNGTLAEHLHGVRSKPGSLPWPVRIKIAVQTASALRYLHASDVIHRDVKTNNILLDNSFRVKVADFGLSRLFPTEKTHVSTAPQGTPGYVDPDYQLCYQLTSKSDVYSFGVVVIELISSMPAVDITRHRQEINLSNMAINKIQNQALHELVDPTLGFDKDTKVRQMVQSVAELAFQCLQADKDLRPTMQEVLNTLVRIQSLGYGPDNSTADEILIDSDDSAALMKSGPLGVESSPDTVIVNWRILKILLQIVLPLVLISRNAPFH